MYQNDYIILFDENGSPYIAHGWFSNLKERVYKYFAKIKKPNGKWRYFYSKAEYEAYQKAKNTYQSAKQDTLRAERTLAQAKHKLADQVGIRGSDGIVRYKKSEAEEAVARAEANLEKKRKAEASAKQDYESYKEDYEHTFRGQREVKKQQKAEEKQRKIAEQKEKEQQENEAKRVASDEKHYQARKKDGFKEGTRSNWDSDKKSSSYSDSALESKALNTMQNDKVRKYWGNNPKLNSAYNDIVDSRKKVEAHTMDLSYAQKTLDRANEEYDKTNEAYKLIYEDPSSSKKAKYTAGLMLDAAIATKKAAQKDVDKLQKLINEEQKDYKSNIQIYNMQLHINGVTK